jgi:hypothetical protein
VTGDGLVEGKGARGDRFVVGGLAGRKLWLVRRPTTSRTPSAMATAMAPASVLREGRILVPFRKEHSGSFSQRAQLSLLDGLRAEGQGICGT